MSVDFPHVGRQRGKTITNANKNKTKNSKIKQKTAALHAPSCRTLTAHARTFPNDNNNNSTQTEHDGREERVWTRRNWRRNGWERASVKRQPSRAEEKSWLSCVNAAQLGGLATWPSNFFGGGNESCCNQFSVAALRPVRFWLRQASD